MRMNLDHVANGRVGYWERRSFRVRLLSIGSEHASNKVCLQCKAAVPVGWKTCECYDHVFRSKGKAECNLREKAMKLLATHHRTPYLRTKLWTFL